jgi:hypothetical protein
VGGGIGEKISLIFSETGAKVVLVDINEEGVKSISKICKKHRLIILRYSIFFNINSNNYSENILLFCELLEVIRNSGRFVITRRSRESYGNNYKTFQTIGCFSQ